MKNNKKFALGSVVALALSVGILAPNAANAANEAGAQPAAPKAEEKVEAQPAAPKAEEKVVENNEVGFSSQAAAQAAGNAAAKNGFVASVSKGANKKFYYTLKAEEIEVAPSTSEDKADLNEGYSTEALAKAAAEEALKNDKVNNGYDIRQGANGRYYVTLKTTEEKTKLSENNENGYETREAAENAAKEALKNDKINNDYDISQDLNGRYVYVLKINNEKVETPKEDGKKEDTPKEDGKKEDTPKEDGKEDTSKKDEKAKALEVAKIAAETELKEAGITSDLLLDGIRKAKTIEGVEALKAELLKSHADSKKDEKKDDEKVEVEENNEVGFLTEENAIAAAKKALENDDVNKTYEITKDANGRYFYLLKPETVEGDVEIPEEKEEEKTPSAKYDPKATEKSFDFDKGFDKKEDAIKQAEALIKNSKINNGYNISQGADGKYYIQLTPFAEKTEGVERKPIEKKADKKADKKEVKKADNKTVKEHNNVKTGVAGLTGVVGTLTAAATALFSTKKRK